MHDARNVGATERWISTALGGLLLYTAVRRRDALGAVAGVGSALLLYRSATGFCPVYGSLGIHTSDRDGQYYNPDASVPYGTGVRVEASISVARPASELYDFWRRLETLAQFMEHVEEVTTLTDRRSRWRVRAPAGGRLTWEAQIINDVPGRLIAWRSLPGSTMHHAGSVHFESRDGMTEVRVVLEYAPPARYIGASMARIMGDDPQRAIVQDLQRFKDIVERGEPANLQ